MRGAVLTRYREPLEFQDNLPMPVAGPSDAVIRVEACGICRSDWHLWQEDCTWMGISVPLPRVPGHEFGGVIEEVGPQVRTFSRGDRVTVPFHIACGHCDYCHTGRSNICHALGFFGFHHNGGFGEYAALPNADVNAVRLPEKVDALSAAALGCRFMTAYHGIVDQANLRPGEWVTVVGAGGVGLASVQIATALGARVIAVSRDAGKLAQARDEGAQHAIEAGDRAVEQIKDLTGGGADVSVDAIVAQELKLFGSLGCPTTSYPGMLSMIAAGQLNPSRLVTERVDASEVTRVFNDMTGFKTHGFHVITSWKGKN